MVLKKTPVTSTGALVFRILIIHQLLFIMVPPVFGVTENAHILQRQTLSSCQYDSDCVQNAFCLNQQSCLCKEGYLVDRNRTHAQCLPIAVNIGDPCTMDVQCRVTFTAQAQCRDGICECSEASHFQSGRCYESKRIGQICQVSNNCYVDGAPSFCVSGICTCPFRHHPNENGTRCLRSSFLGDECSGDDECVARNSRCLDVCRCRVDHVISTDGKRCLKAANTVGEYCEENSQCEAFVTNAKCREDDGHCGCADDYHQSGPICVKSVMLNQACTDHRQCTTTNHKNRNSTEITNVDCIDGSCTCTADYILTEDLLDCIRFSDNGAPRLEIIKTSSIILFSLYIARFWN